MITIRNETAKDTIPMKKLTALLLAVCMLLALSACGAAGSAPADGAGRYPFKTVTMIVPYGAGGTTDVVGRQFAAALGKALGTTFVVENQGGASGAIGCQAALDAERDGSSWQTASAPSGSWISAI